MRNYSCDSCGLPLPIGIEPTVVYARQQKTSKKGDLCPACVVKRLNGINWQSVQPKQYQQNEGAAQ